MVILFFIVLVLKISSCFCNTTESYRLSNDIVPHSYRVRLRPNLEDDFDFHGNVVIDFRSSSDFKCFTLNSKDLKIESVNLSRLSNSQHKTEYGVEYKLNAEKETLEVCLFMTLLAWVTYTVDIKFSGQLNDDMRGIYKIPYEYKNEKKWVVATQFTPTYARMAFPCFDEPKYTVDFEISIARSSREKCIGTIPLEATSNPDPTINDDVCWDTFRKKNSYPLYLLSFAKFEFASKHSKGSLTIQHYKDVPFEDNEYVFKKYEEVVREIGNYMKLSFPVVEADLVALPDGTELTKMSGLDLYPESDLLYNELVDLEQRKENILKAITHKMFHFWFGVQVIPDWWNETWLSESLARLLEYVVASKVEPSWSMDDKFSIEVLQTALFQDEIEYHLAVAAPTRLPREIENEKFNPFIINKGAAILRMLETGVRIAKFQQALRGTLNVQRQNTIITSNDLWYNIQNQNPNLPPNSNIKSIMDKWMNNVGYPIVNVIRGNNGSASLTQDTYKSPRSLKQIPDQEWDIPVRCDKYSDCTSCVATSTELWSLSSQTVTLYSEIKDKEWIICNSMQKGYFRVNYASSNWARLSEVLHTKHEAIEVQNRAMLLDDAFALASDKYLNMTFAFELATYLDKETEMIPWIAIMKHFKYLLQQYEGTDVYDYIKHYILQRISTQYQRIGFYTLPNDSYLVRTTRSMITAMACSLELPTCVEKATHEYNRYLGDLKSVPPYLKYVVFCTNLKTTREKQPVWDKLWDYYLHSDSKSEKEAVLRALACSNDEELFERYLNRIFQPATYILYKYEEEIIFTSTTESYTGIGVALKLISEMLKKISKLAPKIIGLLISFINHLIPKVRSEEHWKKLIHIKSEIRTLDQNKYADIIKAIDTSSHKASINVNLKDANGEQIRTAIRSITGYDPPTTIKPASAENPTNDAEKNSISSQTTPSPKCNSSASSLSSFGVILPIIVLVIHYLKM